MISLLRGKAFVFGNNLDTDQIYPGQYLELAHSEDICKHALEGADPTFVKLVTDGDIVVAGTNFGCGSSREHAAIALREVGVGLVIAKSFARIFYRNAINLGLPLMVCSDCQGDIRQGDKLEIDIEKGLITNKRLKQIYKTQPLSGFVLDILKSGGIKPLVRKQLAG